jgi:hypothetical protein
MTQMEECLPSKGEALSSTPQYQPKETRKKLHRYYFSEVRLHFQKEEGRSQRI